VLVSGSRQLIELRSRFLMGFPLPIPDPLEGSWERKFGRTQPDQNVALVKAAIKVQCSPCSSCSPQRSGCAWLRAAARFPDTRFDQRPVRLQAGTEKRRSNRTEKHEGRRRWDGLATGGRTSPLAASEAVHIRLYERLFEWGIRQPLPDGRLSGVSRHTGTVARR
jgi:hypothetical protein